ncbi:MAG: bifunctional UDP-3-O-[3-hydroxymyristoyl] N-acetylglucosamine deacetylase/3-hydroxyacyl-ACP dehydratase [Candidatus Azobacteroides pseudotrichonymphae]|jgi:UDP-3-O-[3-hydroxymyristoyl] N-acetylglucosamine deacetylase/3-hydroxyacyl-[acyl-carrier-protein] dehydratase|uniref:3-hydroxyacyl-[acyl-carrier-protein] dehydratase FabZ n=1 Tax=Azobacteroides pseudotrichonymphae genomovar. CFP2 TaxID=511995 RepID=B6YRC1_AZOPC|nr:bifunctional UDP-3-O-[3-hydroxymyristoyl] N-acetylglucosamine deacetylase/3-hydroxyacyl-ACP dehydratase [Candidatus Azobacteroides pseudotrichonymphae]MDR0530255.1 bifunctional UDP-3-O-[3-hydroxymyristoyl] N-acetylglucosamine deacetylase/3-hydroxyacyl-ACP dehydratase [Bacteroidales bacterium OttesenSCG-928-I14]BAG83743.1 UDP-3-O-[3-hydroxymyristoyl] N-acetylglucosamine deacetylase/3R-hydroxymyristoyl ACP dehydrase [Candidatus Azobacteroides pseudotrichonymphae genomovar. CFP2]GMO35033.1 MAG: 
MNKQHTLKDFFSLSGQSSHSRRTVHITFYPAPENHGYKIRRTDLDGQPIINAVAENVIDSLQDTTISDNGIQVNAVEHAFAALYALQVDNCLVEVNASEFPILDGTSMPYVNEIERVGLEEQKVDREYYIVKNKMEVCDEVEGSSIVLLPDDHLVINTLMSFDSTVFSSQFATLNCLKDFKKEVAASRTFVFVREVESLIKNNLIKRSDLDNIIIIYDRQITQERLDLLAEKMNVVRKDVVQLGYIMSRSLAYSNEPARHKLLDILGDISLVGRPIRGRIIATCPGHKINNRMARLIRKDVKPNEIQAPEYNPNKTPLMDINRIKELLPHRYPFLLVDKIIEIGEKHIVGVKNVSVNEPFFQGHFPQEPLMPGVLLVEAMAQVGGLLVLNTLEDPHNYSTYFMKIDAVKFRQKVVPGDTLIFHLKFISDIRRGMANMKGRCFIGERLVCEAEFMAQMVKNK